PCLSCSDASRSDRHSFPTRRSSDLARTTARRSRGRAGARSSAPPVGRRERGRHGRGWWLGGALGGHLVDLLLAVARLPLKLGVGDRKSTRLNSSHVKISYAVFCLKK